MKDERFPLKDGASGHSHVVVNLGGPLASAACPRCGYDQRGLIATWRDSCPLESICTECGLVYSCAEVLRPEKFEPAWCVEYCPGRTKPFVRSCCVTIGQSFLPWRFWSSIKMSHRIRVKRLALYLMFLLLPVAFLYLAAQTAVSLYGRSVMQQRLAADAQWAAGWATRPFWYDAMPDRLAQLKEQQPETWEEVVERQRAGFKAVREANIRMADDPPFLEHPAILHVLEGVFLPLAAQSRLRIAFPSRDASQPYTAPIELWEVVADELGIGGRGFGGFGGSWADIVIGAFAVFVFGLILAMLFPLSLALLPMSRRRAKVRWAHIGRITAYGLFLPAVVGYAMALLLIADLVQLARTGSAIFESVTMLFAIGGLPAGTLLWWSFAINRHLKMPHALAVTAVLMLLCFLVILAAVYLLAPNWLLGANV